jgi:hypothetical protein
MRITVQAFRNRLQFQQALRKAGWKISDPAADSFEINHADVHDEATARRRLCEIGLLTSSHARLEFGKQDE